MSRSDRRGELPLTFEARERLRGQQRQEVDRLEALLVAQRRLDTQREKAARVIGEAERGVAARQVDVERAIVRLVETSGLARVAILLGRPEVELRRLVRSEGRPAASDGRAVEPKTVTPSNV
jgi:hypothetical protein